MDKNDPITGSRWQRIFGLSSNVEDRRTPYGSHVASPGVHAIGGGTGRGLVLGHGGKTCGDRGDSDDGSSRSGACGLKMR
jgi:hypothetical protein